MATNDMTDGTDRVLDVIEAELPEAHRKVLDECEAEAWMNVEAGDVHTEEDVAADIVQRLYRIYRVIPHDDGEPGPLNS